MFGVIAAASAGAGLLGAGMGANAAENAAHDQSQAALAATAEQRRQYDQTRLDQMPWLNSGNAANSTLAQLLGLGGIKSRQQIEQELNASGKGAMLQGTPIMGPTGKFTGRYQYADGTSWTVPTRTNPAMTRDQMNAQVDQLYNAQHADVENSPLLKSFTPGDLANEPGYQFGLQQGNRGIENQARARGMYYSPSTVKELTRYNEDYAGTKYNDAFNRFNTNQTNVYNRLAGVSGTGQVSANTLANAGQASAQNIGGLMTGAANARGAAGIAGANLWGNALGGAGNNAMQAYTLSNLFKQPGASAMPWNPYQSFAGAGTGQADFGAGFY